jgi:carboxyl-terminal processing protease
MRVRVAVLTASLCVSSLYATPQEKTANPKLSLHDRVWIATQIHSAIVMNFAHWRGVPNLDFDKEFQSYLDQIIATDDRRGFDMATLELVAKLNNGHTRFWDKWLMDTYGAALGFEARPVETSWVVTQSSIAELRPGDTIRTIDGSDFEDFFRSVRKYIATSSEREARFALVYCPYLFPTSFTLGLSSGRMVHVTRTGPPQERKPELKVQEKNETVYIHIPTFGDPGLEASALVAIEKHSNLQSIVVDVRGNGGGSTPQSLLAKLMEKPYHIWRESTPDSIGIFRSWGAENEELVWSQTFRPTDDRYRGQVYVLIDGGCASACEDFVAPFKETHRGVLIGEPTWGSTGQPINTDLGNGMSLAVSTKRESFPDGSQFEGIGITPDIAVHASAEDLAAGRDPVLEKAYLMIEATTGHK